MMTLWQGALLRGHAHSPHVREEQAPNEVCSVLKLQCFLREILLLCTESIGGQHETESSL